MSGVGGDGSGGAVEAWVAQLVRTLAVRTLDDEGSGEVRLVATPSGAIVATCHRVVVKIHRPDVEALADRLRLAADPRLAELVAAPLLTRLIEVPDTVLPGGRLASVWPRLEVLDPAGDALDAVIPWAEAGDLLARLHRSAAFRRAGAGDRPAPRHRADARLRRALDRLDASAEQLASPGFAQAVAGVRAAGRAVLAEWSAPARGDDALVALVALVHGDWHLGQLARRPGERRWLLIDVDDLGIGAPATDLARPAGFWACGLLDDEAWQAMLAGYRRAGGPLPTDDADLWRVLDVPARGAVVVAAVRALVDADPEDADHVGALDETGTALVQACHRMVMAEQEKMAGTSSPTDRRPR